MAEFKTIIMEVYNLNFKKSVVWCKRKIWECI